MDPQAFATPPQMEGQISPNGRGRHLQRLQTNLGPCVPPHLNQSWMGGSNNSCFGPDNMGTLDSPKRSDSSSRMSMGGDSKRRSFAKLFSSRSSNLKPSASQRSRNENDVPRLPIYHTAEPPYYHAINSWNNSYAPPSPAFGGWQAPGYHGWPAYNATVANMEPIELDATPVVARQLALVELDAMSPISSFAIKSEQSVTSEASAEAFIDDSVSESSVTSASSAPSTVSSFSSHVSDSDENLPEPVEVIPDHACTTPPAGKRSWFKGLFRSKSEYIPRGPSEKAAGKAKLVQRSISCLLPRKLSISRRGSLRRGQANARRDRPTIARAHPSRGNVISELCAENWNLFAPVELPTHELLVRTEEKPEVAPSQPVFSTAAEFSEYCIREAKRLMDLAAAVNAEQRRNPDPLGWRPEAPLPSGSQNNGRNDFYLKPGSSGSVTWEYEGSTLDLRLDHDLPAYSAGPTEFLVVEKVSENSRVSVVEDSKPLASTANHGRCFAVRESVPPDKRPNLSTKKTRSADVKRISREISPSLDIPSGLERFVPVYRLSTFHFDSVNNTRYKVDVALDLRLKFAKDLLASDWKNECLPSTVLKHSQGLLKRKKDTAAVDWGIAFNVTYTPVDLPPAAPPNVLTKVKRPKEPPTKECSVVAAGRKDNPYNDPIKTNICPLKITTAPADSPVREHSTGGNSGKGSPNMPFDLGGFGSPNAPPSFDNFNYGMPQRQHWLRGQYRGRPPENIGLFEPKDETLALPPNALPQFLSTLDAFPHQHAAATPYVPPLTIPSPSTSSGSSSLPESNVDTTPLSAHFGNSFSSLDALTSSELDLVWPDEPSLKSTGATLTLPAFNESAATLQIATTFGPSGVTDQDIEWLLSPMDDDSNSMSGDSVMREASGPLPSSPMTSRAATAADLSKPHHCTRSHKSGDACTGRFKSGSELRKHIRSVHEKSVTCRSPRCAHKSGTKRDRMRHELVKHPDLFKPEEMQEYFCDAPGCEQGMGGKDPKPYLRKDHLRMHKSKKHGRAAAVAASSSSATASPSAAATLAAPVTAPVSAPSSRLPSPAPSIVVSRAATPAFDIGSDHELENFFAGITNPDLVLPPVPARTTPPPPIMTLDQQKVLDHIKSCISMAESGLMPFSQCQMAIRSCMENPL